VARPGAAVICMFSVVMLEAMLNFSVPLYIQIIQGRHRPGEPTAHLQAG
jgi:hypothetical protein